MNDQENMDNEKECVWQQDFHDEWNAWNTDCGEMFCLDNEGPKENNMRYCCYCGKRLKEEVDDGD